MKPEGMEDKIKRPYVPEATVRLLINHNKFQKTVLRVNPQLPLETLLPLVCDKCEMRVETTVLLRDYQSKESLDIAKTLDEHGRLREVFAWDTADNDPSLNHYQPSIHEIGLARQKRRAPLPPMGASQSVPNNLGNLRGSQRSTASDFRRSKRKAPPPPCGNKLQDVQT
ncbi:cordon-bleu protein-like 1 isoform X2 [Vanacampus margaritifer]